MAKEFRLPKSIPVFCFKYRIKELNNLSDKLEKDTPPNKRVGIIGRVKFDPDEILLEKKLKGIERLQNFLHEVTHCVTGALHMELNETEIEALSLGFTPVINKLLKAQK